MLFVTLSFVAFFALTAGAHWALPAKRRWMLLLGASSFFYATFVPAYLAVLLATIVVDYVAGIVIEQSAGRRRTWALAASIAANVGVLFVFKYYDFLARSAEEASARFGGRLSVPLLGMALPLGLSFHTFQAMSYTIEVYRGAQRAERHFGVYALYVMFFPQLVAGPIERPQNLLPQFRSASRFDYAQVASGLRLMACGAFKKVVVADRLAAIADPVFDAPRAAHGLAFLVACVVFTFQSYYDFAGYSDMARGAARVLGYELMLNFDRPFASRSMAEYWKRWHISLSTWFRDYLYIPLGGNRVPALRLYANVLLVFVLSGAWHGANWTFVAWGAINGAYLVLALAGKRVFARWRARAGIDRRPRLAHAYDVSSTFALVVFASIFFRAASLADAWQVARGCFVGVIEVGRGGLAASGLAALGVRRVAASVLLVALVEGLSWIDARGALVPRFAALPAWARGLTYELGAAAILVLQQGGQRPFIYFQF